MTLNINPDSTQMRVNIGGITAIQLNAIYDSESQSFLYDNEGNLVTDENENTIITNP